MFRSGWWGTGADVIPELAARGVVPDILTDQTSAHDPLNGYVPNGMSLAESLALRQSRPKAYGEKSLDAISRACRRHVGLAEDGLGHFDYGNNIRTFVSAWREETLTIFPDSCLLTFVRCSARGAGHSGGWRCREKPLTFT